MEAEKALRIQIAMLELISISDGLTESWRGTDSRTQFLQTLAADAKRTGQPQTHRLSEAPVVRDATPYWNRLKTLVASPDYQELKNWIGGIKK